MSGPAGAPRRGGWGGGEAVEVGPEPLGGLFGGRGAAWGSRGVGRARLGGGGRGSGRGDSLGEVGGFECGGALEDQGGQLDGAAHAVWAAFAELQGEADALVGGGEDAVGELTQVVLGDGGAPGDGSEKAARRGRARAAIGCKPMGSLRFASFSGAEGQRFESSSIRHPGTGTTTATLASGRSRFRTSSDRSLAIAMGTVADARERKGDSGGAAVCDLPSSMSCLPRCPGLRPDGSAGAVADVGEGIGARAVAPARRGGVADGADAGGGRVVRGAGGPREVAGLAVVSDPAVGSVAVEVAEANPELLDAQPHAHALAEPVVLVRVFHGHELPADGAAGVPGVGPAERVRAGDIELAALEDAHAGRAHASLVDGAVAVPVDRVAGLVGSGAHVLVAVVAVLGVRHPALLGASHLARGSVVSEAVAVAIGEEWDAGAGVRRGVSRAAVVRAAVLETAVSLLPPIPKATIRVPPSVGRSRVAATTGERGLLAERRLAALLDRRQPHDQVPPKRRLTLGAALRVADAGAVHGLHPDRPPPRLELQLPGRVVASHDEALPPAKRPAGALADGHVVAGPLALLLEEDAPVGPRRVPARPERHRRHDEDGAPAPRPPHGPSLPWAGSGAHRLGSFPWVGFGARDVASGRPRPVFRRFRESDLPGGAAELPPRGAPLGSIDAEQGMGGHRDPATVRVSKVDRVLRPGLDRLAERVLQRAPPGRIHGEGDELEAARRHGRLPGLGQLEHQDAGSQPQPDGALAPLAHAQPEAPHIEALEAGQVARAEGQVVDAHGASMPGAGRSGSRGGRLSQ